MPTLDARSSERLFGTGEKVTVFDKHGHVGSWPLGSVEQMTKDSDGLVRMVNG